jgi:hypothetical protein
VQFTSRDCRRPNDTSCEKAKAFCDDYHGTGHCQDCSTDLCNDSIDNANATAESSAEVPAEEEVFETEKTKKIPPDSDATEVGNVPIPISSDRLFPFSAAVEKEKEKGSTPENGKEASSTRRAAASVVDNNFEILAATTTTPSAESESTTPPIDILWGLNTAASDSGGDSVNKAADSGATKTFVASGHNSLLPLLLLLVQFGAAIVFSCCQY